MQQVTASVKTILPRIQLHNGTVEALKWVALFLMTCDHVNKYLLNETVPWMFDAGRLTMPIFVFVLAYNLARPDALERGVYQRTMIRLAIFGALATPAFIALGGLLAGWWPLNIMFALLTITAVLFLIEQANRANYVAAFFVFVIGGSSVEFWWPAVAFGVAVWLYIKTPSMTALAVALLACALLGFINRDIWALAALPILAVAARVRVPFPRLRWVFYVYYPAHLSALWIIRIPMRHAGYLFFT